jgi:hypothetical protein
MGVDVMGMLSRLVDGGQLLCLLQDVSNSQKASVKLQIVRRRTGKRLGSIYLSRLMTLSNVTKH